MSDHTVRAATPTDADSLARLYNHYVENTVITFEETPVSAQEMASRIESVTGAGLPWLLAEHDGHLSGYAYATPFRPRSAYRFTVESTVYLAPEFAGQGVGTLLYRRLLEQLPPAGVHAVIGGIALPNEASIALHERVGFHKVAHLKQVGRKFDRWIDVGYWQFLFQDPSP